MRTGGTVKLFKTVSCFQSPCFKEGLEACFLLLDAAIKSSQLLYLPLNVVAYTQQREKVGDKTDLTAA